MRTVSDEQQIIISKVSRGENVVVDACAGSGKSTTILSTALAQPDKKFLLITYNKSLRKEILETVRELDLQNITVHTYHSFAVSIYDAEAHVDKVMRLLVENNKPPSRLIATDILVLDEAQDMTFLYFRLIVKYLKDLNSKIQIMILGDYMQGLYEFKGADIRFLTKAIDIWSGLPFLKSPIFSSCSLKTSYRITQPMADFVNNVMLNEPRLKAVKEGEPVVYIRRRIYDLERFITTTIRKLIQDEGAKPSDFFILGGSVKGPNSLIRRIENVLVDSNIPCHVPMMENSDQIDEEVINGKIVFSSFHTSKGRQRPYVFIIGFDHSYFKTVARTLDPLECPNTLYVATTRASQRLYLLESDEWASDRSLKFLKMTHLEMKQNSYIDFRGIPRSKFEVETISNIKKDICHKVSPTELTKFISESVLEEITSLLDTLFIKEICGEPSSIPTTIRTVDGFYEDVSDLNGIAIPSMLYDYISVLYDDDDTCILYKMIIENLKHTKPNKHLFLKNQHLIQNCQSVSDT
jgi:superfamily I DNA/RNA helicase